MAQIGWIVLIFVNLPLAPTLAIVAVLVAFEMIGPFSAEHRHGPTPWHPHHIAERYSLLVIIALGEVVLGTILTISAGVQENQWTVDAALLAVAVAAVAAGATLAWGLLIVAASPAVLVVGYEAGGWRRKQELVARVSAAAV
ncbi:MAG: low temperature requirement protein A [Microbacterium hominis]|nr:low temperature requirement protein A [Microbacterium hominis]